MSPSGHLTGIEAPDARLHSVDMPFVLAAVVLTARFYTVVDIPSADRSAAMLVASNILRAAGIEVTWKDCRERPAGHTESRGPRGQSDTIDACLTPINPDEVIVRFVSAPATAARRHSSSDRLGDAYVDTTTAAGTLATIYVDRVAWMARAAGVDVATVLGRVMAHEIGHLLLGTTNHQPFGLMRAEWSTTMLQRRVSSDWRLSARDAASARAGLLRRTQPLQAAAGASPVVVPCAIAADRSGLVCPSCPVCTPRLPTDWLALHLLVEPGF